METVNPNPNADRLKVIDGMQSFEECIDSIYHTACNIKRDQTSLAITRARITSMHALLDLLEEYTDQMEMIEDQDDILRGLTEQCAIETEEWEKESRERSTCPHCGTVWEDHIAALTCPCLDDDWMY